MSESKELLKELLRQLEEEETGAYPAETAPAQTFDYLKTSMEERTRVAVELLANKIAKDAPAYRAEELEEKLLEKRKEMPRWAAAQPLNRELKEE